MNTEAQRLLNQLRQHIAEIKTAATALGERGRTIVAATARAETTIAELERYDGGTGYPAENSAQCQQLRDQIEEMKASATALGETGRDIVATITKAESTLVDLERALATCGGYQDQSRQYGGSQYPNDPQRQYGGSQYPYSGTQDPQYQYGGPRDPQYQSQRQYQRRG